MVWHRAHTLSVHVTTRPATLMGTLKPPSNNGDHCTHAPHSAKHSCIFNQIYVQVIRDGRHVSIASVSRGTASTGPLHTLHTTTKQQQCLECGRAAVYIEVVHFVRCSFQSCHRLAWQRPGALLCSRRRLLASQTKPHKRRSSSTLRVDSYNLLLDHPQLSIHSSCAHGASTEHRQQPALTAAMTPPAMPATSFLQAHRGPMWTRSQPPRGAHCC